MKEIPYGRQSIDASDIKQIIKVLRSDLITQGPKIKEFETALCNYTGAKYSVAVSSGTAALHLACLVARIESGDEVITSPLTFAASANCVLFCGGKTVFADVQEDTINIDPEEIKKKINKRTKAVIPIDFAGHPCDLEKIYGIAKEKKLVIIEDAAHSLGAEYRGSKIGSCRYSDMAIFSFHPVKSITTGEGGAVLTNRADLYEKLLMFRNHGITKDKDKMEKFDGPWYYEMQELGFNYRITDFQCALGINQLKKIDRFIKRRRQIASIYHKKLARINEIELPGERHNVKSAWHLYAIRLRVNYESKRKELFDYLRENGIGAQVHYIPVYYHPYYQKLGYKKGSCPVAESFYRREISIPLYQSMKNQDIEYVAKVLGRAFKVG